MKQCKGVCTIILFAIQILDATSVSNRTQDIPDVSSEGEQSFLNRIFHYINSIQQTATALRFNAHQVFSVMHNYAWQTYVHAQRWYNLSVE